jgi:hypothetical protein
MMKELHGALSFHILDKILLSKTANVFVMSTNNLKSYISAV